MKILNPLKKSLGPIIFGLTIIILIASCKQEHEKETVKAIDKTNFTLYSKNVRDSFYISVQLPLEYSAKPKSRYPVAIVTDANFFFPMLGPALHQYEKGGLLPPMILVGIGYKSFELMDSLRVRDYMFPKAIPSDEMKAPGGGERFYQFITTELLPVIDSAYRTRTANRTLMGHSFGGYFSSFALLQQLNTNRHDFRNFISASPSLWYNNNYLFQLTQKVNTAPAADSLHLFLSVGSLEEPKWSVAPVKDLSSKLLSVSGSKLKVTTTIYTDLDHMDVGLISFIKGLEVIYNKPEH